MANKRKGRNLTRDFTCPECDRLLFRVGGRKYFLHYQNSQEISQHTQLSRKKASLVASRGLFVDQDTWIEDFFCGDHGRVWLLLNREQEGKLKFRLACESDWQRSSGTINPNVSNPSVSEFSYRMSRRTGMAKQRYHS